MRVCPKCRELLAESVPVAAESNRPTPGDWTLCGACGTVLRFDAQGQLVIPPAWEKPPQAEAKALEEARLLAHRDRMSRIGWKRDDMKQLAINSLKGKP